MSYPFGFGAAFSSFYSPFAYSPYSTFSFYDTFSPFYSSFTNSFVTPIVSPVAAPIIPTPVYPKYDFWELDIIDVSKLKIEDKKEDRKEEKSENKIKIEEIKEESGEVVKTIPFVTASYSYSPFDYALPWDYSIKNKDSKDKIDKIDDSKVSLFSYKPPEFNKEEFDKQVENIKKEYEQLFVQLNSHLF